MKAIKHLFSFSRNLINCYTIHYQNPNSIITSLSFKPHRLREQNHKINLWSPHYKSIERDEGPKTMISSCFFHRIISQQLGSPLLHLIPPAIHKQRASLSPVEAEQFETIYSGYNLKIIIFTGIYYLKVCRRRFTENLNETTLNKSGALIRCCAEVEEDDESEDIHSLTRWMLGQGEERTTRTIQHRTEHY